MAVPNTNIIVDLLFSDTQDAGNWNTNAINPVANTGDGYLRLVPDSEQTFFKRTFGNIDATNNRLSIKIDLRVVKHQNSNDQTTDIQIIVRSGETIVQTINECISDISTSVQYFVNRELNYTDLNEALSIEIKAPSGFGNFIDLKSLSIRDFTFCQDSVRMYFVIDGLLEESRTAKAGRLNFLEFSIGGVESLTTQYFAQATDIIDTASKWFFAKANISGSTRVQEDTEPNTLNMFETSSNLVFDTVNSFHGGKPTGTQSGDSYGNGIESIGVDLPCIVNNSGVAKDSVFFVDMDLTKNYRVVFEVVVNENPDLYQSPKYYRRYVVEWSASNCTFSYMYTDLIRQTVVDQNVNGFLRGLTPQKKDDSQLNCSDSIVSNTEILNTTINYGSIIGQSGIDYELIKPIKVSIIWNNQTFTTGFVGSSVYDQQLINLGVNPAELNTTNPSSTTGTLVFNKSLASPETATIIVENPLKSEFTINGKCPEPIQVGNLEIGVGNCQSAPKSFTSIFIEGIGATTYNPTNGDVIYTDAELNTVFNGNNLKHMMRRIGGALINRDFNVSTAGVISNSSACIVGGGNDNTTVTEVTNETCFTCWSLQIDIPDGESRQVQFISNFVQNGSYSVAGCSNVGTAVISDTIINITENTTFRVGMENILDADPTQNQNSTINVIVRNGGAVISQQILTRLHGPNKC